MLVCRELAQRAFSPISWESFGFSCSRSRQLCDRTVRQPSKVYLVSTVPHTLLLQEVSSDSVGNGVRSPQPPDLESYRGSPVTTFLSRQFHRCQQCLYGRFSISHKYRPLTSRFQTPGGDLDWRFRRSLLRDRGCLYCSRLLSTMREHHQHVVNESKERAVQPTSRCHGLSLFSRFHVLDRSHRKYTNCETEDAPCALTLCQWRHDCDASSSGCHCFC